VLSSVANVTMKTFDQDEPLNPLTTYSGCMNGHNSTAPTGKDFPRSLAVHAYSDIPPPPTGDLAQAFAA
jgi:hypothetical protein